MHDMHDILIKLLISMALGFVVGLEREIKHKPVGFKTMMVMSVTCCLISILSIQGAKDMATAYKTPMDPYRLAAQAISGIGFLGAGVILRRNNDAISGLTTAAVIWASSAIGLTVGAGYIKEACITTAFILICLNVLPFIVRFIGPKSIREKEWQVELCLAEKSDLTEIFQLMKEHKMKIRREEIRGKNWTSSSGLTVRMRILANQKNDTSELYHLFCKFESVKDVKIESL